MFLQKAGEFTVFEFRINNVLAILVNATATCKFDPGNPLNLQ